MRRHFIANDNQAPRVGRGRANNFYPENPMVLLSLTLSMALAGCGVSLEVTRAVSIKDREICIVDNPGVQQNFRTAYERQIQKKGCQTKIVQDVNACPTVSTYDATYGMHWGVYLATANLRIFSDGKLAGEAFYERPVQQPAEAWQGRGKIKAMVVKLFP
jgi:hypothetical protein